MFKKMFALASVTALVGLVSSVAATGCSSTSEVVDNGEGGTTGEGGKPEAGPRPDGGGVEGEDSSTPVVPEEGTVGKLCDTAADCKVPDAKKDNVCSKGGFQGGDLFGSPICIQPKCQIGNTQTIGDYICDGEAGLCLPTDDNGNGICLGYCDFESTKIGAGCQGSNKCAVALTASDTAGKAIGIGFCSWACQADADCKGTANSKCQVETGTCLNADKVVAYAKAVGAGCDGAAKTEECNCNTVGGAGASKDKGVCTRNCLTGAAGNAVCNTAVAGWKCTAGLPAKDDAGKTAFTAQPDDLVGQCALPCTDDTTCAPLAASTGAVFKCIENADGKFCETTDGT